MCLKEGSIFLTTSVVEEGLWVETRPTIGIAVENAKGYYNKHG